MKEQKKVKYYSKTEEILNVATHGTGLILSIVALVYLVFIVWDKTEITYRIGFITFGVCMVLLYAASTAYHAVQQPEIRRKLNVFDHAAIYLLIAGTYTPFMLIVLEGAWRIGMFILVWGLALAGIVFKLFFTGRFDKLSTGLYLLLGWLVVIAYKPFVANVPLVSAKWLLVGGIAYTVGAFLYMMKKMPYNHAVFHVFVLVGTASHFVAVLELV